VVDAASPTLSEQRGEVERVLAEIGAHDIPQILVYNKLDRITPPPRQLQDWVERAPGQAVPRVFVSALQGTGLDVLRALIAQAASIEGLQPPPLAPAADDAGQAAASAALPSAP
jgi:GTP-binding protein HflX